MIWRVLFILLLILSCVVNYISGYTRDENPGIIFNIISTPICSFVFTNTAWIPSTTYISCLFIGMGVYTLNWIAHYIGIIVEYFKIEE